MFTSLKAVICLRIRFTNLHCITRLESTKQRVTYRATSDTTHSAPNRTLVEHFGILFPLSVTRGRLCLLDVLLLVVVGDDDLRPARFQLVLVCLQEGRRGEMTGERKRETRTLEHRLHPFHLLAKGRREGEEERRTGVCHLAEQLFVDGESQVQV